MVDLSDSSTDMWRVLLNAIMKFLFTYNARKICHGYTTDGLSNRGNVRSVHNKNLC
jgi:hypothetical protein